MKIVWQKNHGLYHVCLIGRILLIVLVFSVGPNVFAEEGDALFIDQDGTVKVKRLDVEGKVSSQDIKVTGTVDAKKYIGDGSNLTIKTKTGESTLKSIYDEPIPVGSVHWGEWILALGEYGSAEIEVKPGDIVKVDLIGSAEQSEFYYNILETTGNAEIISTPTQVIMNPNRWRSITTTGLFKAKASTTLRFSANFTKRDVSGKVKVFGLALIAIVVGKDEVRHTR